MKITELLHESRTDEVVGAALRGIGAAGKALFPKAATAPALNVTGATSKYQAAKGAVQAVRSAGLDPKSFFGRIAKRTVYRDALKNIKTYQAQARAQVIQILGDKGLQFANLLYIGDSIYDYYTAKAVLDEKLANGSLSKDEYENELTDLRGLFITGFLVPKIAGGLTRLTAGNAVNLTSWLIKTVGFPKQAIMLKALKDLTIKGGQGAMLAYFSTDAGRQWLTDVFGSWITGFGNLGDFASGFLDYAKAAYQVATDTVPAGALDAKDGQSDILTPGDGPTDIMMKAIGGGINADPFKGITRERP